MTSPKALLLQHGLRAKHHFGQNFLADEQLCQRIAELASTPPGGTVLELGAGLGALTKPLLERASRVVAVERDRELVPVFSELFRPAIDAGQLTLVEGDAKTVDWEAFLESGPAPRVLAGNLPYQITGPLLERAVQIAPLVERVVFLVQLEVAARVAAAAGEDDYGALSVYVQARFQPRRALVIRRGAFYPQPGVDSAVLVLEPRPIPLAEETATFRQLVSRAFSQRRKTLRNAWSGVLGLDPGSIAAAAAAARVSLDDRGERLDARAFARMARALGDREQPEQPDD